MAKFRSELTGAEIDVPEEQAKRMGAEWRPVSKSAPKRATRRSAPKSDAPAETDSE